MRRAPLVLLLALAALPGLASCGGDDIPPPEPYTVLHYEYLKPLRLNVASVDVQDMSGPPVPGDVTAQDPVSPREVLAQMGQDRLFAAGSAGRATFTVQSAAITQVESGALNGVLAVQVAVFDAAGRQVASTDAQVTRRHEPGSDPENLRNNLYDMTRDMMSDMNVELEYRLRQTMRDWLVSASALPAPVTATPLNAEPLPSVVPAPLLSPPATPDPGQPDSVQPYGQSPDGMAPPQQMSPPPGYLQPLPHPPGDGY